MMEARENNQRIKIYNTMSRRKETFIPIEEGKASIYVCGPTVYNFFHIGNARPFVVFDTLRRFLKYMRYDVKFVQNFTDVDDKIINKAKEEGVLASEISERYIDEYFKDAEALNVVPADVHPKVSEHIQDIITFIEKLIESGHAYESDGDVYFIARSFPQYGKLSGQNIDDLESGARIAIGEVKRDPLDFALWKARKTEDEISWDSPWGKGRPGWHIECSVMSKKHLGATFDIHAGGQDLQFPHHENEIAQSESCNNVTFANYWMHNGYITIDNEKMSKSKGNFFTVRDILKQGYDGEILRFFLLSGHYRSPINFSDELIEQSKAGLARIKNCHENLIYLKENSQSEEMSTRENEALQSMGQYRDNFVSHMCDDLNTADAISDIFQLVTAINTANKSGVSKGMAVKEEELLLELCHVIGILEKEEKSEFDDEIMKLVEERQQARKEKNYARADEIRDILAEKGIQIKDTPQGVQLVKM